MVKQIDQRHSDFETVFKQLKAILSLNMEGVAQGSFVGKASISTLLREGPGKKEDTFKAVRDFFAKSTLCNQSGLVTLFEEIYYGRDYTMPQK